MTGPEGFPAGWYDDPNQSGGRRYYDGENWTDQFTPPPDPALAKKGEEKEQHATGTVIAGYIFAVIMPLVGFIIGLTQINRNRHGLWVVLLSIAAFFGWVILISALAAQEAAECTGYYC
jgi:hypothetical protein